MTQLTLFGPEAAPFIFSVAYHLAWLDHCVMVVQVKPIYGPSPIEAAHLAGIRLGELQVRPEDFDRALSTRQF